MGTHGRRLIGGIVVAVATASCCLGAPAGAGAEVPASLRTFGDNCAGTELVPGSTATVLTNGLPGNVLSTVAPPEGNWVITRWRVAAPAGLPPTTEQLVAFKQVAEEEDLLVGESEPVTVVGGGANEFTTRVPIPEYGHIGMRGPSGALVCGGQPQHLLSIVTGPWAVGQVRHLGIEVGRGVPMTATVEADRDGDGYGDETQDGCPASVLVHTACPFVRLAPVATAQRQGIQLEVSTGDPTRVEVAGYTGWTGRGRGGAKHHVVVQLAGGVQEIGQGATVGFWLVLPPSVRAHLAKLPRKKNLKAHLTIVATDVLGHPTVRELAVPLPGRRASASSRASQA